MIRHLGSLRMAVPLLIAIAAVLAWGTLYETRFGTAAVQRFIYQAWWFQGLLAFLALNLGVAALGRRPWQRKHVPFLLAHLGIICILVGGILSGRLGIEGQLVIPEGETANTLRLPQGVLVVHPLNPGSVHTFPATFDTQAWRHAPNITYRVPFNDQRLEVTVDRYYPNAQLLEQVTDEGAQANPAVHLTLSHEGQTRDVWLFAQDPERFGAQWGQTHLLFLEPATAEAFRRLTDATALSARDRGAITVALLGESAPRMIPVPDDFSQPVVLEGTPYRIVFRDYFSDLAITEQGVVNRSLAPNNPAVAFALIGPEGVDPHLVFALHPEFSAMHGRQQTIQAHVAYHHPAAARLPPQALAVVKGLDGALWWVMTGPAGERQVEPFAVGQRQRHPWRGFEFEAAVYYPQARVIQEMTNRDNDVRSEAIHLVVHAGSERVERWLAFDSATQLVLGGDQVHVEYRKAIWDLPVSIRLLDFRKRDYPGTQIASDFESDVELTDPTRGVTLRRTIRMNTPLKYGGFSFFQSSFIEGPVETTVLSVRKDPGTPCVYTGFLIVVAGIVGLFCRTTSAGKASAGTASAAKASAGKAPLLPTLLLPTLLLPTLYPQTAFAADALDTLRQVAIQHRGRVKPFESFAREALWLITGRTTWRGQDPTQTVLSIVAEPERWQGEPLIAVPFGPLRGALGLARATTHVSYNELIATRRLMRMLPAIVEKQGRDEKLTMLEQETMDAFERFVLLNQLFEQELALVPPSSGQTVWQPILQQAQARDQWQAVVTAARPVRHPAARGAMSNGARESPEQLGAAVAGLAEVLRAVNPSAYPPRWRLQLEVGYHRIRPFVAARLLCLAAAVALMLALAMPRWPAGPALGMGLLGGGFLFHGAGLVTRIVLGGRPPVSNFYETMLWIPFVAVALALIFEQIYRARYVGAAAGILAALVLALADQLPLDPSVAPVVAVLRSNLWLSIHVLTIVASYGALALAAVLAHLYGGFLIARGPSHPALPALGLFLYRCLQVGIVLLASGIMLGAVWANASWGRYWGWDPKETWALITLLWFLAVLHGRFAGWLKETAVALATIGGFFLLLMTYYGVSFYLVGLHSYAGGHAKPLPPLLVAYLAGELLFMASVGARVAARS